MIITEQKKSIQHPEEIVKIFRDLLASEHECDQLREHFWVVGLNAKNIIQYIELVSLGTLTSALIHPRETFRFAVMKGVASIIVVHNHPSGDPTPSREDIVVAERLKEAGDILGIKLLDSIIVCDTNHSSLQALGHI